MDSNKSFTKECFTKQYGHSVKYIDRLPEGIAEIGENGERLIYRTTNRNGEDVFSQGYICLFLKSEKEALISLDEDLVEVRSKDGKIICSVNREEWNNELANIYYSMESYDDTFEYTGALPEGIAEVNQQGKKLIYRTVNRNGENVLRHGYICLFLKSEKEAHISLDKDLVEVRSKDGKMLFSTDREEWDKELANMYYNQESMQTEQQDEIISFNGIDGIKDDYEYNVRKRLMMEAVSIVSKKIKGAEQLDKYYLLLNTISNKQIVAELKKLQR